MGYVAMVGAARRERESNRGKQEAGIASSVFATIELGPFLNNARVIPSEVGEMSG